MTARHRYDGSMLTPDEDEAEANARLIAAAPEMYGLLQGLYDAIAGEENGEYMDNTGWLVLIGHILATRGLVVRRGEVEDE